MDYGVCLPYGGCVAWTLLYDTLYAHQDKKDDSKLKLRSSALTIGDQNTPMFLRACGVATVSGLGLAGFNAGFHDATAWPFYAASQPSRPTSRGRSRARICPTRRTSARGSGATASSRRSCLSAGGGDAQFLILLVVVFPRRHGASGPASAWRGCSDAPGSRASMSPHLFTCVLCWAL